MFNQWKKIDLFIALLFIITGLSYLFFRGSFRFFLNVLIIVAVIRLFLIIKKKLLWKTRNRLIFSGLFFIVTPIILIGIFFFFLLYVIIAQYGVVIVDNLIKRQLSDYENNVNVYLLLNDKVKMLKRVERLKRYYPSNLLMILSEKQGNEYKSFFKHPYNFEQKNLRMDQFSGYFKLKNRLYLGVLKKNANYSVLIAMNVNQAYLDELSTISDFKIRLISKEGSFSANSVADEISNITSEQEDRFLLPWPYKYKFFDFDEIKLKRLKEKEHYYLLAIDYDKILLKLKGEDSKSIQVNIKKGIYFLIGFFTVFIVISFFIGIKILRVITKSVNQITKGIRQIMRGDFSYRIKIKSGDQLQYLAESFNEMASGIGRLLVEEKEKQRLEEELRIARGIQLRLLPEENFITDEFDIAAINIPADEVAGDYFDYFYKKGKYMTILVADVSGKGTSAAFYMAEMKGIITLLQKKELSPKSLIVECHSSLCDSFDKTTFITMNMARFIIPENKFIFARAGHTQAVFFSFEEKECFELSPEGMAIGLTNFSEDKIQEIEINYKKGDILFLFSDGLSEIMNEEDEMLGIDNLKKLIQENHEFSAKEIKQKILDFSIKFSETKINRDDLTFIVLKVK